MVDAAVDVAVDDAAAVAAGAVAEDTVAGEASRDRNEVRVDILGPYP